MMTHRKWLLTTLAVFSALLAGCQTAGPMAIGMGRERYNAILQKTTMDQTLANIVRVYHHEPPMFMDVTEVDASLNFGGGLAGGATGIGARRGASGGTLAGQVESASGTANYSETPTIRYQPLLGQALVAQLTNPVSVDAIAQLYDSSWNIDALLNFSAAYLTTDYREFYPALNAIAELADSGGIWISAGKIQQAGSTAASQGASDSLLIFFNPFRRSDSPAVTQTKVRLLQLWIRLVRIYSSEYPDFKRPQACDSIGLTLTDASLRDWDQNIQARVSGAGTNQSERLNQIRQCLPSTIALTVGPSVRKGSGSDGATVVGPPAMRTYSALGILKNATERPSPRIEFLTKSAFEKIRSYPWNADVEAMTYYTVLADDLDSYGCPAERLAAGGCEAPSIPGDRLRELNQKIEAWLRSSVGASADRDHPAGVGAYESSRSDVLNDEMIDLTGRLGTLRKYILIIASEDKPDNAYVSYFDHGEWYYIDRSDTVSQKNFQLISLFLTMMAVAPTSQPISPTINVGG